MRENADCVASVGVCADSLKGLGLHFDREAVIAMVKPRGGASGSTNGVIDFAKRRLGFRCPTAVTFVDTIPKTPYGKIDRTKVIAALTAACQTIVPPPL